MPEKGMLKIEGIRCDNPSCSFELKDIDYNQYQEWIEKPCPGCGEPILSMEDYNTFKMLIAAISIANKLDGEESIEMGEMPVDISKVYTK